MSPRTLERVTRTAPLGVRPWDGATGRPVTDGLRLTEVRHGLTATPNRSGVFVFHDLPGLRAAADGAGDDAFWATTATRAPFELELTDSAGRYLAFRMTADAPARGLFAGRCPHLLWPDDDPSPTSPPDADGAVIALFSAPSRPVPPGLAAVRADLHDAERNAPAAWAVLEVTAQGATTTLGVADERGRVLVLLAYPEPRGPAGSPPSASRALADETWPLALGVRYGARSQLPDPAAGIPPDLCAVLGQPAATLLLDDSPRTPMSGATLAFSSPLTLRTPGRSVLLVSPA